MTTPLRESRQRERDSRNCTAIISIAHPRSWSQGLLSRWVGGWTCGVQLSLTSWAPLVPTIHTFTHTFIHSFVRSFIHSSIHLSIHLSIYSLIHSFIHSFINSFIHSFMHSSFHQVITTISTNQIIIRLCWILLLTLLFSALVVSRTLSFVHWVIRSFILLLLSWIGAARSGACGTADWLGRQGTISCYNHFLIAEFFLWRASQQMPLSNS